MQRRKRRRHGNGKSRHLIGNTPLLGISIGRATQRDTPLCEIIGKAERNCRSGPKHPSAKAAERRVIPGHHQASEEHDWPKQGDFQQFVFEVRETVTEFGSGQLDIDSLNAGMDLLAAAFSPATERQFLEALVARVRGLDESLLPQPLWSE
jgi:hypothetical protein